MCGTFGLIGLLKLCGYEKDNINKLQWKELAFISFAGLIRGAIAFGLVLRLDPGMTNRSVIVTTCLTLVVFTTVVFGSTIGILEKCLFKRTEKPDKESEVDELLSNNTRNNYNKLKVLYE
jgi:NhaP-type Na+/H+ or K+/H+ antiporter